MSNAKFETAIKQGVQDMEAGRTTPIEDVIQELGAHYTIKEVASIVGIPKNRVQFYVNSGLINPQIRAPGKGVAHGFSRENIRDFMILKKMSEFGFSLKFIKELLKYEDF